VVMSLLWNASGLGFVVYLLMIEAMLHAICPLCTVVHVLVAMQACLSYYILNTMLEEKTHLRAQDLQSATIIVAKPWLVRVAVAFLLPTIFFNAFVPQRPFADIQLASVLGVTDDVRPASISALMLGGGAAIETPVVVTQRAPTRTEQLNYVLQCLHNQNVRMFGSFQCSHCLAVKKMFAPLTIDAIYVECTIAATGGAAKKSKYMTNAECGKWNITGYPSFIKFQVGAYNDVMIEEKRKVGQMSPAELAVAWGCTNMTVAPSPTDPPKPRTARGLTAHDIRTTAERRPRKHTGKHDDDDDARDSPTRRNWK